MSRRALVATLGIAAVAVGGALGGVLAVGGSAKVNLSANSEHTDHWHGSRLSSSLAFATVKNPGDPTFNQLLGINNRDQIAGYFGSGAAGHPNKGYVLNVSRRSAFFQNENFPFGVQTQVIGINDRGVTVGFWSNQNTASQTNANFGFYSWHGRFHNVNFPTGNNASPPVNQLLGVNNSDIAVGFYTDAKGNDHAYEYSIFGNWFHRIHVPGAKSVTASGINNRRDIAGFYVDRGGVTRGFLWWDGNLARLSFPGATSTMAFGVNDEREVVGTYMTGSGNNAKSFGFTWTAQTGFRTVNAPLGVGATTLNGINDAGDLVGFYTDAAGNTDGLVAAPTRSRPSFMPRMNQTMTPITTPMVPANTTAPVPSGAGPTHF